MATTSTQTQTTEATTPSAEDRIWDTPRALREFFRHRSPQILGTVTVLAWLVRLFHMQWSWLDAALPLAIFVAWPVVEWLIHIHLLHARPFKALGYELDLPSAVKHRRHHRHPQVLEWSFIPLAGLVFLGGLFLVVWHLLLPTPQAWTAFAFTVTLGLHYEWVHAMSHMPYKPPVALYRYLREKHRLHHFRNEQRWWGVSMTGGDILFGTGGDKQTQPKSETCFTLDIPEEYAKPSKFFDI